MNAPEPAIVRTGHVRWFVCALLFAIVALNYTDRQVLSVLKPTLQQAYGWSETGYGDVVFWFQAAYGLGYVVFGRIVDRYRRQGGRHHRRHHLDRRPHRPCLCDQHRRLHLGAHSHGAGRIRPVPLHPGGDGGMVSPARAGAGHRHLQCRLQCRRHSGALHRAHHHHRLGLADGLHPHRPSDLCLAGGLADLVPPPARDDGVSAAGAGYIESDPQDAAAPGAPGPGCSPPARPGPICRAAS